MPDLPSPLRPSLGRYHFKSSDHIPIAALGMVVELSNRIPRRQPLDAPLFRHDALVARYDERSGVHGHGTPKRCIYPPIRTSGLSSAVFDTPRAGKGTPFGLIRCLVAIGKPTPSHRHVDLSLTLFGIALLSAEEAHRFLVVDVLRTIDDLDDCLQSTNSVLAKQNMPDHFFEGAVLWIPVTPDFNQNSLEEFTERLYSFADEACQFFAYWATRS